MQLTNTPGKLVLPFANAGAKNDIPAASQIGITAGAASLTDGFPPLTMTPVAAGGVPPSGLDMNGILYKMSNILRWANAGGGYAYDSDFANDSHVGGYPKGARVMRSDGMGYWFNTVDNNATNPEDAGAAEAGWVPDFTNGVTSVAMASANVTLTPLQYGKPIIVITGTLTANLNLIFPAIAGEWTVVNNTSGAFSIFAKTSGGPGVTLPSGSVLIFGDGTNINFVGGQQQPGEVSFFARNTAPPGYLKANGAAVSRTAYSALFAAIGTTFGAGDGSATFNLPDLRGEFLRGFDDGRGIDAGRVFGSLQLDVIKSHRHSVYPGVDGGFLYGGSVGINNDGAVKGIPGGGNGFGSALSHLRETGAQAIDGGQAETRPRNVALLACIKY